MAKVYSNQRRTIWVATTSSNPFANPAAPTVTEVNALANVSAAIKWDSTDLGMQSSDQIDDRVLTDAGTKQSRGFLQFGGTLNLLTPKDPDDTSDPAVIAAAFFRTPRTNLWIVDRVVYLNNTAAAAGQHVNIYQVITDATKNQTSGDTSYSYTVSLLPQGSVYPQTPIAAASATALTITGIDTTMTVGQVSWGQAVTTTSFQVGNLATWSSSDTTVATVDNRGVVTGIAAGSADISAVIPGYTAATAISVTVS